MSIADGQRVRALESNTAWQSKTQDNTITGVQTLSAPGSGPSIPDEQQAINDLITDVGTLETSVLTAQSDISDLQTLSGVPDGSTDLGTFTGVTIPDNSDVKEALQALETEVELKEDAANKGAANGYAPLDGSSKIPLAYIPTTVYIFQGLWDASTNTPTLSDGTGTSGHVYKVSVAGTQDLGSGSISYSVGDELYHNGTAWEKLGASSGVTSVNGNTGVVVLDTDDISEGATNLYYTDARFDTRFGTKSIDGLNDVDTTGVAALNFLRRNSGNTAWEDFDANQYQDDSTTGSNATLSSLGDVILKRLTSGSLVSVDMIPAGYGQQRFILLNKTGVVIQINNLTGGTAANQIITGTGATLSLEDNKSLWLIYDSVATKWTVVGGTGTGTGGDSENYITGADVDAELSNYTWDEYQDAAGTDPVDADGGTPNVVLSRTSVSAEVQSGDYSFKIAKDAANRQGEGVRVPITTDNKLKGRPTRVEFDYDASANFVYGSSSVASDLKPVIVDVTSGAIIQLYPNWLDGSGKYVGEFIATQNTSYRLALHVQTTNALAWDFFFDNIKFKENPSTFIPLDSDWEALSGITGTWVTNTTYTGKIKKAGDSADLQVLVSVSGAPTATALTVTLPFTIDTAKLMSTAGGASHLGLFTVRDVSASITYVGQVTYTSSTTISLIADVGNAAGNSAAVTQAIPMTFAAGDFIDIKITNLPVVGWTSGFVSSSVVGQNIPAVLRTFKNAGSVTANTTIPTWTTVSKDTVGGFDSSTGVYTVKVPGQYRVSFKASTTAGTPIGSIRKNGTIVDTGINSGTKTVVVAILPDLVFGDQITVTLDTSLTIASDNVNTTFELEKIETPQASLNVRKVAFISDQKAAGTEGGGFTSGAFQTRDLNTLVDPFGIVSLSSNQFTLQAGTYRVRAKAPAYSDAGSIDRHQCKIRNVTDSTDTLIGSSEYNGDGGNTTSSFVEGLIVITSAKTFALQHRCGTTQATFGFGLASNFGVNEVYATVEIEKLL